MSNEETLQEYNTRLEENNTSLDDILTTINNLPEGGSSGGSRSIITVGLSSDTTYSTNGTIVPLTKTLSKKGDELSLDTTTGAVKIGAGVSKILVSGTLTQEAVAPGLYGGNIHKNATNLASAVNIGFNYVYTPNQMFKTTFHPVLVDVAEGDLIYLTAYTHATTTVTVKAYDGRSTNITVEVVE